MNNNSEGTNRVGRRTSRRVSFASKLQCQELKADGTTLVVTQPFDNNDDDDGHFFPFSQSFNNRSSSPYFMIDSTTYASVYSSQSVDNDITANVVNKKARSPQRFYKSIAKNYDWTNKKDSETIYNTSYNRFGKEMATRNGKIDFTILWDEESKENEVEMTCMRHIKPTETTFNGFRTLQSKVTRREDGFGRRSLKSEEECVNSSDNATFLASAKHSASRQSESFRKFKKFMISLSNWYPKSGKISNSAIDCFENSKFYLQQLHKKKRTLNACWK